MYSFPKNITEYYNFKSLPTIFPFGVLLEIGKGILRRKNFLLQLLILVNARHIVSKTYLNRAIELSSSLSHKH